jgi:tetratricopeptide (TPR) repeat protein
MNKIDPIGPPDSHHLLAAQGWAELGDFAEADAELQQIASALRAHPQLLAVRYDIYARSRRWDLAADIASMLVESLGGHAGSWISLAYAVRRKTGGGLPQAREILTKALSLFPREAIIVYNLACYDCQLGLEVTAMEWLKLAITLDSRKGIKTMALADTDLKPLWEQIEQL